MTYALGIDVGTTFTAAATVDRGRAEVAALGHSSLTVPSIVYVREDRSTLVGQGSVRRAAADPEGLARDFKRRMGDPVPLLLRGTPFAPEQLTGSLLSWVVETVTEQQGSGPEQVALSHPANWTEFQTSLLRGAAQIAGLSHASMVTEPEAAAVTYATTRTVGAGTSIAVYDLGGGTFDATVLRRRGDGGFELVGAPQGIDRLGGIDFDLAVLGWVERQLGDAWASVDRSDPTLAQAMHTLRNECVAAKEDLSSDNETSITVLLPGLQRELRLTRTELEDMIRPSIGLTVEALGRAIASAQLEPDELESVLLVGGSSRIPLVAEMVATEIGIPTATDAHPKFAIALGTALWAANETAGRTRVPGEPAVRQLSVPTEGPRGDGDDIDDRPTVVVAPRDESPRDDATVTAPSVPIAPSDRPPPPPPPSDRRDESSDPDRSRLLLVLAVVVVALAAIGGFVLFGGGDDDTADPQPTTSALGPVTTAAPPPTGVSDTAGGTETSVPATTEPPPTTLPPATVTDWAQRLTGVLADVDGVPVTGDAPAAEGTEVPDSFSPAGFASWAAGLVGVELPDGTVDLYTSMAADPQTAVPVSAAAATPGVVVFDTPFEPLAPAELTEAHAVGVSLGDGRVVVADAAAGAVSITDDLNRFAYAAVPPVIAAESNLTPSAPFLVTSRAAGATVGVGLAADAEWIFVSGGSEPGQVAIVDPVTLETRGLGVADPGGGALGDLVHDDGVGWVSAPSAGAVARVIPGADGDPEVTLFPVPRATGDLYVGDGRLFGSASTSIVALDTTTGESSVLVELPDAAAGDVHGAFGALWYTDLLAGVVRRVDPTTGADLGSIAVGAFPVGVISEEALWVTVADEDRVVSIDPATDEITASVTVGDGPWSFALAPEQRILWVANRNDGTVSAVDIATATELARIEVGPEPDGIAAVGDMAFVSTNDNIVTRLRLVIPG